METNYKLDLIKINYQPCKKILKSTQKDPIKILKNKWNKTN